MKNGVIKKAGFIQAGDSYVDGNRIGEVSNAVMRDRKVMAVVEPRQRHVGEWTCKAPQLGAGALL